MVSGLKGLDAPLKENVQEIHTGDPVTNKLDHSFDQHPNLQTYFARISARPAFRKQVAAGPLALRLGGSVYRRLNRIRKSLPRDYARWRNELNVA